MSEILTKSEYAGRRKVKPAAVSNWIARKKLTPPAVRSDGRIDVVLADQQLAVSLDTARRIGRPPSAARPTAEIADLTAARQIAQSKAVLAVISAEKARRDFELQRGRYCLTAEAEARFAEVLAGFVQRVEQSLNDLAMTLHLDRQQVVVLRRWWRDQRAKAAERNGLAVGQEPQFVEDPERREIG